MIKLLYGKADYLIKKEQDRIVQDFVKKNPQAGVERFDAEEDWDANGVRESLVQGGGLFSTAKLIIIKNIDKAKKGDSEMIAELLKKTGSEQGDIQIILTAGDKPPKKEKMFSFLFDKNETVEFKKLQGPALQKWIKKEVADISGKSLSIEQSAVSQLELMFGKDLWQLSNVLNVLANYCEGKEEIKMADVDKVSKGNVDVKIFDFVDALGAKNKQKATELFHSLLNQGENEFYILSMIFFQLRNLVKVFAVVQKGAANPDMISKQLGIHPFVAKKTLGQLRNFSKADLKRIYQEIADLDFQAKVGEKTVEEGVVDFIAGL